MDDEKAMVAHAIDHFNEGDLQGYLRLYAENCVFHGFPPRFSPDIDGVRMFYSTFGESFADTRIDIEDLIGEEGRVAVRYVIRATHTGEFLGVEATGNRVEAPGITILRFENDKVVERWQSFAFAPIMSQIGVLERMGMEVSES
jgi:steroid delta-isomerase-like uncharacterized protein